MIKITKTKLEPSEKRLLNEWTQEKCQKLVDMTDYNDPELIKEFNSWSKLCKTNK